MLQENYFSYRLDISCSGVTLPWQANGLALMVLPIKPQSFVAAQTHFSLSLYGLQQTTHVTFVWVIYCLGKGSMKLLFRENHWNSLAGSIRVTSFRNITTKLSLIKWKYSDWGKTLLKSNQQNFHKPSFINLIFTSHLFPKKTIFLALTILLHVPSNHVPHYLSTRLIKISKMRAQTHSLFKLLLSLKEDFLKFKFKYLHSLSLAFLDTQSNCCFRLFDSLFVSFDINIFFLF